MSLTNSSGNNNATILVVEDSPTQAQRLEHILVQWGFHVMRAANGRLALEELQRHKPDMIISDVIMPEMDGYELCRRVKNDARFNDVPVILVTTLSDPGDVIRGLECRADNFILKPYDERYLVGRVQFVLLNRQMRRAEQGGLAVDIYFNGQKHVITADRLQILNLLLSTYEAAIQRNKQLTVAEEETRCAENFLSSIIENVPSTIFVKDAATLRYVRVNRAFEELIGRPRSDILGREDHDLFPADEADLFTATDREALGRDMLVDVPASPVHTATAGLRLLHTQKLRILDGGVPRYVLGISDDITERQANEKALAAAKVEAERANRAKSDFLSRMSHDLRTPLNAILGFAQLLEMDVATAEQRENAAHIVKAGNHLLGLINEILDIARIEAGHLSLVLEPVPVEDLVQNALDLVRPLANEQEITVDFDTRTVQRHQVFADRQRLSQVLLNLLANAVKYTRSRGRVTVRCDDAPPRRLRIGVSDTGPGIPPEKVKLLFQPFERLGAERTGIEGTGLGLTLSKALTEAMAGTLTVETESERGSTFWVELPVAEAGVQPAGVTPGQERVSVQDSSVTGTVLYIEDNVSNRRLMERVFTRRPGVRLVTVSEGQDGLELGRAEPPDLILLDLHLPDMHGEEVLRQLREDPRTRTIPVAVLSADAMPSQIRRLLGLGATHYLTKPIDIGEVLQLLDRTLPTATLLNPRG